MCKADRLTVTQRRLTAIRGVGLDGSVEGLSKKEKKERETHRHGQQCGPHRGLGAGEWKEMEEGKGG